MYELVAVYHTDSHKKEDPCIGEDLRKVIFTNLSEEHITITVADPRTGVAAEATIRKDSLPDFVRNS